MGTFGAFRADCTVLLCFWRLPFFHIGLKGRRNLKTQETKRGPASFVFFGGCPFFSLVQQDAKKMLGVPLCLIHTHLEQGLENRQ